jgi:hypothetical protein
MKRIEKINGTFKQAKLTYSSNSGYSIFDLLRGYNEKHVEIMKIDIEGKLHNTAKFLRMHVKGTIL